MTDWDDLAARATHRRRTLERAISDRQARIDEHANERMIIVDILDRNEKARAARELRSRQEADAREFDEAAAKSLDRLVGLLRAAAREPAHDLAYFRSVLPTNAPPTLDDVSAPPRPQWAQYSPAPPGLFGRRRYERAVAEARARWDAALEQHDRTIAKRLAELTNAHSERLRRVRSEHEREWAAVTNLAMQSDAEAIAGLAGTIVVESAALDGLIESGRATYDPEARELVVEIDVPDSDVLPVERGWKYVDARKVIVPVPWKAKEPAKTYVEFVTQVVLAVVDTCFRGLPREQVDTISINGHVLTINPATGQPAHPCVVTVSTDREAYEQLDLSHPKLDPTECLKALGAVMSPNPHALDHIQPLVDFDLAKYRIAHGPEALAEVDHRTDLLKMDAFKFERLVSSLFAKMGYDTWTTESRRDDGIDAVAIKADPHMPIECIIQAKRFKGVVSTKDVQALMGAMAEKPSATHGFLVTTSWLSPRSRQRARALRIHTIERNQLAYLIKEHLGIEVLISNSPPTTHKT